MRKLLIALTALLFLGGFILRDISSKLAPEATPTIVATLERPTPAFITSMDMMPSELLLTSPDLLLVSVASIEESGGFANQDSGSLPPEDSYVYQYPGAEVIRQYLVGRGVLDQSLWTDDATLCSYDMADNINAVRAAARDYNIPLSIMGPLVLSEASFTNTFPAIGRDGCILINNGVAAGLGQIYKPAGWSFSSAAQIHPEVNVWDLFNPYVGMQHSASILDGRQYWNPLTGPRESGSSWFALVAGYKNISQEHEHFQNVFLKYYYSGGFAYTHPSTGRNYWISFNDSLANSEFVFN